MQLIKPAATSYRGRFAPSPTGPMHFGSLVTAVGSYLQARQCGGIWLVRIEDLDTPRNVPAAADGILQSLETLGMYWDEAVLYQSKRIAAYEEALQILQKSGRVYPCACSRKEIADSALHGIEGQIYSGTCRHGIFPGKQARSWRVHAQVEAIEFDDALQGRVAQSVAREIGDFVVQRADGVFAYQLAVVVDDAFQRITHVIRGADLLASTPRQINLQRLLNLPTPNYMHLPIAVNRQGEKLSKQTLAPPVDLSRPARALLSALAFLRQDPPAELATYDLSSVWDWALANWDARKLKGAGTLAADLSNS